MVPMVKTFLDILGALGSFASLEAEIRTAVSSPSAEQAKEKLQRLNIVEDFSNLPSEIADILDASNIELGRLKRELQGDRFFADGEKAAIVSQIYARNPKFSAYKELIDPLIQDYLDYVEKYLLEMMSSGCARKPQAKAVWAEWKRANSKAPGKTQTPVINRLNCEGNQHQRQQHAGKGASPLFNRRRLSD